MHNSENAIGAIRPGVSRRNRPPFHEALWHGAGLGLVLATASFIAWGGKPVLETSQLGPLIISTLAAYLLALWANWRMLHFPVQHSGKVILANLGLAFLIVLGLLAFGRFYFSRSFLLSAFAMSLSWQWLGLRMRDKTRLRLAVVPGGSVDELLTLRTAEWVPLIQPTGSVLATGLVADADHARAPEWARFLADCAVRGLPVYDARAVYEAMTGKVLLSHDADQIADQCSPPPLYSAVKQMVDIGLVIGSLVVTLPLMAMIAMLIRLDSAGAAFFWQERVGKAGKIFRMVKFRTMHTDHEQEAPRFAVADDHRITRLGRWLRRFRLDELPQIWNVLQGEMSLIGPRPEQVPFAEEFAREIPLYPCRHLVKPGISGWAQVNHGYASGHEETRTKLAYDLYYVKRYSFWLDLLIALRTLPTVVLGHGAR